MPVEARPDFISGSIGLAVDLWTSVIALIIAWFARGPRAMLLAWLLILGVLGDVYAQTPVRGNAVFVLELIGVISNWVNSALIATIASTFGKPLTRTRKFLELATYVATAIGILVNQWQFISDIFSLGTYSLDDLGRVLSIIVNALALGCAVLALRSAKDKEKQRSRWLLLPLMAIDCVWIADFLVGRGAESNYWTQNVPLAVTFALLQVILPLALTYAVLRRRLVDVEFVANRAAVFAGVSFIVIGIFVVFEWLFNSFFERATHTESTLASLVVALALGMSLRYIHGYVDKLVDGVFFRKRHEREQALRDFAYEAAFITDRDTLLDDTIREVRENTETATASILLHDGNGTYATARTTDGAASNVGANDRAIVKLRAWHKPLDLHEVETAIRGTRIYPLMSRGELLGALVCGDKHDHQGFAPDEDDALFTMARGVGSALGTFVDRVERDGTMSQLLETMRAIQRDLAVIRYGHDS